MSTEAAPQTAHAGTHPGDMCIAMANLFGQLKPGEKMPCNYKGCNALASLALAQRDGVAAVDGPQVFTLHDFCEQ